MDSGLRGNDESGTHLVGVTGDGCAIEVEIPAFAGMTGGVGQGDWGGGGNGGVGGRGNDGWGGAGEWQGDLEMGRGVGG